MNTLSSLPVVLFQVSSHGLELFNRAWEEYPGLTPESWLEISHGGWRKLIPQEFHAKVRKLGELSVSEGYTVVEFPVYWLRATVWLLIFAVAVEEPEGGRKIVGLAQDVTFQREWPQASFPGTEEELDAGPADSLAQFCHDMSGPLTSILVNCELLMEGECPPSVRQKVESILSEALHLDQHLRSYRRV